MGPGGLLLNDWKFNRAAVQNEIKRIGVNCAFF
jgi:hypothetical protein